jgi:two-component system, cell cycle sensor histidine kinase and response regulator CckA
MSDDGATAARREFQALQQRIAELEQALEAERARRQHHEHIFANVNDAVIVIDATFRVQEWNTAAERIYGWAAAEAQGHLLSSIVPTRYLDASTDASVFAVLQQTGVWTGLVAQRCRDGHEIIVESGVRHLRDSTGAVIGLVGINRDVTRRYQAEAALRASEAHLRAFFESAPEAYYLLDRDYRILAFNQVTAQSVRAIWQTEIAVGDSILSYVNPANRELFIAHYQRCLAGEANRYERKVTYPSGETHWYELSYQPIYHQSDGAIIGVAFGGLDITARKQTELALAQREAQLAGIIDSAMDAIITVDAAQRIVLFNRAAEQVFGVEAAEVLGQPLDRFIPPALRAAHRQHIPAFGETGVTRRSMYSPGLLEAVHADGHMFPIEASISQLYLDGVPFYTVILRDISMRVQLEAQLLQAQKLESIGRLAGGVAHDFNNLLTVIGGATELARDMLPPAHPALAELAAIQTTTERAASLTRQLLAFARRQILAPRSLDVNALICETEQLLRRLIGEDIQLCITLTPGLAPIHADPNQLQQVLLNLAVNARDAMPSGGQLAIQTQLVVHERVASSATVPLGRYVRIVVADTGIGITPEVQTQLFEPFFTTKGPGQGTGLGLATSFGIVTQHGGTIGVESEVGVGTTFFVDLPTTDVPPIAPEPLLPSSALPQGQETILLVEDDGAVRAFAAQVLRSLGYRVVEAADGVQALQQAELVQPIDLLLTDIMLPRMSGTLLAHELVTRQPTLRVLYMSGYADHAKLPDGTALGPLVLPKPFGRAELARAVRVMLKPLTPHTDTEQGA